MQDDVRVAALKLAASLFSPKSAEELIALAAKLEAFIVEGAARAP